MNVRDVIYIKLNKAYPINQQLNETISRNFYFIYFFFIIIFFFETVKSKVIILLFGTVRLSFRFHLEISIIH